MTASTAFGAVNLHDVAGEVSEVSARTVYGGSVEEKFENAALSVIGTTRTVLSALALIYLVYVGIMMVVASGGEDTLTKQKRQLTYGLVAFLFLNIPGTIFSIFGNKDGGDVTQHATAAGYVNVQKTGTNLFMDFDNWGGSVEGGVLMFVKIALVGAAIFLFTLAGIKVIASGGKEESLKEAKNQILYGVLALIFMGVIQAWVTVVYRGDISGGQNIFAQLSNMALFFAGPVAIFFLIMGAYYYITSAGDDERAKKGKNIVVNTFIATIILLASYAFLKDLADFRP